MINAGPRALARQTLLKLYQFEKEQSEGAISEQAFFPVNLTKLVGLLGWQLRSLSDLREEKEPISGRSDFSRKLVFLDQIGDPRWRFTLAHEIGHIVLDHGCVQFRRDSGPRSVIRPKTLEPADPLTTRREADANA